MSSWYYLEIGDNIQSPPITELFMEAFLLAGQPNDMAVFIRHDLCTDISTAYFSPSATKLAVDLGALPCDKPSLDEYLILKAGLDDNWKIHFPERDIVGF